MNEATLIAILIALAGAVGGCYAWLRSHEIGCREWQRKLLEEHGALKADVARLLRREDLR